MTREEAEKYIKSKMCSDCGVHLGGGKCLDNCNVIEAIKALEQESSKDMEEIEEVINCDADAEIKLKMISNIVHSKPHYFKTSRENKIIDEHYWKGFSNGIRTAEWRATKQEPAYCDRNICIKNEYNGVGCDECEVTKSQEPCEDAISREDVINLKWRGEASEEFLEGYANAIEDARVLPSVKPQESCDVPDINDGDIISKQTVLDTISELNAISFYEAQEDSKETYYEIRQAIKDLSPVKQEPQTGHWIKGKCDQCGGHAPFWSMATTYYKSEYCPNCGCRMVEPQESEDKCKNCKYYRNPDYTRCHECKAESEK